MNTQSLKIIVADDETPARNRLRELLAEIDGVCVVGEARNGKEALMLALDTGADLVLLDIRMPQMDGIEAAGHLQKVAPPPAIIFTTAFDSYAMQAFDVNAVDYLLKPIRLERLQSAIAKARALLPGQLAALQSMQRQRTHFSVTERGRVLLVPVADVIYLRAELKYLTLRTRERSYLVEDTLTAIEQEFGDYFLRLHRNCLVAQHCILGYEKRHDGDSEHGWTVLLRDVPDTLAVSRRQHHVLRKLFG